MDRKDGICQVTTDSISCDQLQTDHASRRSRKDERFQLILNNIKERRETIATSRPVDYKCPNCGQLFPPIWDHLEGRWVFMEISESGICRQCQKLKHIRENIASYLTNTGVPKKFVNCSFENFPASNENAKCIQACREFLIKTDPESPSIYLFGKIGSGKTHLAVAIMRELLLKDKPVLFSCVPRLCAEIKKTFQQDAKKSEQDIIDAYISCEYLVLVDLDEEKPTEWFIKTLNYILYERDITARPTIITSRLSLDDIAKSVSQRMALRICSMGQVMRLQGPNKA